MAREIADQLVRFGKVARGQLGVSAQDRPAGMPQSVQGETRAGAMVVDIVPGSAAETAGLRRGDIIVAINGKAVVSAAQLRTRIGLKRVGESIAVEFLRGGDRVRATAVVTAAAS